MRQICLILPILFSALVAVTSQTCRVSAQNETQAHQPVTVIGTPIRYLLDDAGDKPLSRVFNALTLGYRAPVSLLLLPPNRARRIFASRGSECFFVANNHTWHNSPDRGQLILSAPINATSIHIFSPTGTDAISDVMALTGKRIATSGGTLRTVSAATDMPDNAQIILAGDTAGAFELLMHGRVDTVLAFREDALVFSRENKVAAFSYAPDRPILAVEEGILCWKNDRTNAFIAHINASIQLNRVTGNLQRILGDIYALPAAAQVAAKAHPSH